MATLLGTPYERGKSDTIVSRYVDAPIEEGLIVADEGNNKVAVYADGKTPYGVMGQNEIVGASVVLTGLRVWVQASEDCEPVVGAQVFVNNAGKVTSLADGNTGVKAEFASTEVKTNGLVNNTPAKATNRRCVLINFVGGF